MNQKVLIELLSSKLGSYHLSGHQLKFFCPNHSHHKRKLEINLEKGLFNCWICNNFHGHIGYLAKIIGLSPDQINSIKQQYPIESIQKNISQPIQEFDFSSQEIFNSNSRPFFKSNPTVLDNSREASYHYVHYRRDLTDFHIKKYSIQYGFTENYQGSVMFPSFDVFGRIDGFISRFHTKKQYQPYRKYLINKSKNFQFWNQLFVDPNSPVYITEGVFDYIKLDRNGICLAGSNLVIPITDYLLQHKKDKYFCLDKDANIKSLEMIRYLLKNGFNQIFMLDWKNSSYKDLGEMMNSEECQKYVDNNLIKVTLNNINLLDMEIRLRA